MRIRHWLPITLLFATTAVARQDAVGGPYTRHLVLQVEQEQDYGAHDLVKLLSMDAYIGAIAPNLAVGDSPLANKVAVAAGLGSSELMTLSFVGHDHTTIDRAVDTVVNHLTSLVPTRRRTMHESLARAEHEVAEAQAKRDSTQAELGRFRDENGSDTEERLSDVQVLLRNQRSELAQIADRLAVSGATRDFLRETIRTEMLRTDESIAAIHAEYESLGKELAKRLESNSENHPEVVQLKAKLARLEPKLAGGIGGQPLQNLEQRLFVTEEEVFSQERRREWLQEQIKMNVAAERVLAKTRDAWIDLRQAHQFAERRVNDAQGQLDMLTRDYSRMPQGAWIRVVAGALERR